MKAMRLPLAAIFFMTFSMAGGGGWGGVGGKGMVPSDPLLYM